MESSGRGYASVQRPKDQIVRFEDVFGDELKGRNKQLGYEIEHDA